VDCLRDMFEFKCMNSMADRLGRTIFRSIEGGESQGISIPAAKLCGRTKSEIIDIRNGGTSDG